MINVYKCSKNNNNSNNNNNIPVDQQIYSVLKSLKLKQIDDELSNIMIMKNSLENLKSLVVIMKHLNIITLHISESFLQNKAWFDIIKANIMEYASQYCFNHDNWV
mmetsp:Transcript_103031/g.125942  ORF Transcript_103031/g.125942 Transcript_103031/m.125942 type:complete len:106 (-) Transcript_103031:163-480(-)